MPRLVLRFVVSLVLFVITISLASKLINGVAFLLLQAGSPMLHDWNLSHYAWRAVIVGVLAGIAPGSLLFSTALWLAKRDNPDVPRISQFLADLNVETLQRWMWLFAIPPMIHIVLRWVEWRSHFASVFDSSSHYSISNFVEYWSSELSYVDPRSRTYVSDWSWLQQVFYIWLISALVGYSLAPLLRKLGQFAYRSMDQHLDQTDEKVAEESTINEKIDPE